MSTWSLIGSHASISSTASSGVASGPAAIPQAIAPSSDGGDDLAGVDVVDGGHVLVGEPLGDVVGQLAGDRRAGLD